MNRRGFFKALGVATAVTAAGLVVPDVARKFFLPPAHGWAVGSLKPGDMITIRQPPSYDLAIPYERTRQYVVIEVWGGGGGGGVIDGKEHWPDPARTIIQLDDNQSYRIELAKPRRFA